MRRIRKGFLSAAAALVLILACTVLVFADTAYITTDDNSSVRMRESASTDSDVVVALDSGIEVEVLGTEGEWTQISYNGYTGYVMSTYLTAAATTDDETAAAEDTTTEDTTADTTADTTEDAVSEDTTAAEDTADTVEEEETVVAEDDTELEELTEKLAQYKKFVMILGLACLILVIIIINLLLFYRRGYDDYEEEYDDEADDAIAGDAHKDAGSLYEPMPAQSTEPVKQPVQQDAAVPDISKLVDDTTAEVYGETKQIQPLEQGTPAASDQDGSDELEFFDLDDL